MARMAEVHLASVAALLVMCLFQTGNAASAIVTANATIEGDTAVLECAYSVDTEPLVELTWSRDNGTGTFEDVFFSNDTMDVVVGLIDSGSTGAYQNVSNALSHLLTIPSIQASDQTDYRCTVVDSAVSPVPTESSAVLLDVLVGCESSPCQNGGLCNDTSGSVICECDPNYTGVYCETMVDECASDPCMNGGTCMDGINNYTCNCLDCYTGYDCESQKVNECASDPCQNGATCVDECDRFVCECAFNYQGTTCAADCDNIDSISSVQTVWIGSPVSLSCSANSGVTVTDFWWSSSSTGSTRASNAYNYTISKLLESNDGTYYCFMTAGGCTSRSSTVVNVKWEIFPNTTKTENVTMKKGSSKSFECSASGTPDPTVQWRFTPKPQVVDSENGTLAVTAETPTTVYIGNGSESSSTLELSKVQFDDAGTYECVATLAGSKDFVINVINLSVGKKGSSGGLKDWEIALIVIACIIVIVIIVVIIVFIIMKKKNDGDTRGRRSSTVEPSRARPTHQTRAPEKDMEMKNSPYTYSDDYYSKSRSETNNDGYGYAPRALPVPKGDRGGKLPSLDVESERERMQHEKKQKKQRRNMDEGYNEEDEN